MLYILLNLLDLDHLSEKLILTGPSGTATSLVTALSAGPSCAILNLCTNFTIIMYNSSLANLCPMHALGILSQCSCCQGKPGAMTPGQVGERVSAVSLFAVSQPPFRNELFGIFEVVWVVGHAVPHPDHHRALGHLVAAYHCVSLHRKVKTRIICELNISRKVGSFQNLKTPTGSKESRTHSLTFSLTSLQIPKEFFSLNEI